MAKRKQSDIVNEMVHYATLISRVDVYTKDVTTREYKRDWYNHYLAKLKQLVKQVKPMPKHKPLKKRA